MAVLIGRTAMDVVTATARGLTDTGGTVCADRAGFTSLCVAVVEAAADSTSIYNALAGARVVASVSGRAAGGVTSTGADSDRRISRRIGRVDDICGVGSGVGDNADSTGAVATIQADVPIG